MAPTTRWQEQIELERRRREAEQKAAEDQLFWNGIRPNEGLVPSRRRSLDRRMAAENERLRQDNLSLQT